MTPEDLAVRRWFVMVLTMVPIILLGAALLFASMTVLLVAVGVLRYRRHIGGGSTGGILALVVGLLPWYLATCLAGQLGASE